MTLKPLLVRMWNSRAILWFVIAVDVGFYAPTLLGYLFPPVTDFAVNYQASRRYETSIVVKGESRRVQVVRAEGSMNKRWCKFLGTDGVAFTESGQEFDIGVDFRDRADLDQTKNRDSGPQPWGPWVLTAVVDADVWAMRLRSTHRCGWGAFSYIVSKEKDDLIFLKSLTLLQGITR